MSWGTLGEDEKCMQDFGGKISKKSHLGDLGVDGSIIIK